MSWIKAVWSTLAGKSSRSAPPMETKGLQDPVDAALSIEPQAAPEVPAEPAVPARNEHPRLTISANADMERAGLVKKAKPLVSEDPPPPDSNRKLRGKQVSHFVCAVVGESHKNRDGSSRQALIRKYVCEGDSASLRPEPTNPYDKNAVAVFVHDKQIGYLKREVAERWVEWIGDDDFQVTAIVHGVHGGTIDKPSLGVTIDMAIYQKPK